MSATTPSRTDALVEVYPADIDAKLGFETVRSRIRSHLQSEAGFTALASIKASSSREEVEERLGRISEWQELLVAGDAPAVGGLPDLSDELEQIGPAGAWLEPETLLKIAAALAVSRTIWSFFDGRQEVCPASSRRTAALFTDRELEDYISDIVDPQGEIRDQASSELRRIRREIADTEQAVRRAANSAFESAEKEGFAAGDAPTVRGGRLVIPIWSEARRKGLGVVVDSSASGQTVFVEPEACLELGNELRILEGAERREVIRILTAATDRIRPLREGLLENQTLLGLVDYDRACGVTANEMESTDPVISEGDSFRIVGGRNPVLTLLRLQDPARDKVVPLDLELETEQRTLVISGPNAGGKSVALKTIGLMSRMLAYGLPLPAKPGTELPLFGRIMVEIGDQQSLEDDLSTFSSHIRSLRIMLDDADADTLVLVDEIGRGTDPLAGSAVAQAVLEELTVRGARTVVTTHFGNLKAFAHNESGVQNGSMVFDADQLRPTYVFAPEVPGSSYAFEIASRTEFPPSLLQRARDVAGESHTALESLLNALELEKVRAEELREELEKARKQAEAARTEAEADRERLRSSKDEILARAESEAQSLLDNVNRRIERTIREIRESQAERERTQEVRRELEDVREEVETRIRERSRPQRPTATPEAELNPGDRVVLDGGTTQGEVVEAEEDEVLVVFGSMQTRVDRARLTRVGGKRKQEVRVRSQTESTEDVVGLEASTRIDLRGLRVDAALGQVDRFIDRAIAGGLQRVEILHGKGTGALRQAVREHLGARPEVASVDDAPISMGGAGLSIVVLD